MAEIQTHAADFTVENKHFSEITKNQSKIENYFNIKLIRTMSLHKEYKNKDLKWIRLEGEEDEDCRNAKEYILAITEPAETKYLTIAKEIQAISNWKYVETIEKQTRAYIESYRDNLLKISGSPLSVALALSILEDKLGPYQQLTSPQFKSGDIDDSKSARSSVLSQNETTSIIDSIMENNVHLPDLIASSGFRSDNETNCKLSDGRILENLVISNGASSTPLQRDSVNDQLSVNKQSRKESLSEERLNFFRNLAKQIGHEDPDIQDALKIASEDTKPSDFIRLLNSIKEDREIVEIEDFDCEEFHPTDSSLNAKSSLPDSYVKMLLNDYEEESELSSIDDLKRRNQARQKCLREHTLNRKSCPMTTPPQQQPFTQIEHLKMKKTKKKNSKQPENLANPSPTYPLYPPPPLLGTDRDIIPPIVNQQIPNHQLYQNRDVDNQCTPCYKGTPPKSSSTPGSMAKSKNIPAAPQLDNRRTASNVQQPKPLIERHNTASPNSRTSPVLNDRLRYIVVDGSNIAMTHGNGKFSCRGIQIVVDYFISLGHNVMAFVPQHKFYTPNSSNNILDQDILYQLKEQGHLAVTPSRKIQKKLINCYDDRFILDLAEREDGIVVSNDQYRDLIEEKPSWREIIEKRLLMYTFVQDNFMLPADPLGRDGPTLEEFLSKTPKETNSTPKKSSRPPPRQVYNYSTIVSTRPSPQGAQRNKPTGIRPQATNSYSEGVTLRTKEESERLYRELKMVFSEDSQDSTLRKILDENLTERNIIQLSDKFVQEFF